MYGKKLLLSTLLLTAFMQAETGIGLDINNEDVEVLGEINFNSWADYSSSTAYILDVNYLHTEDDNLAGIGFRGQNTLQGAEGLTLSFGARLVYTDDFMALPLMAKASYLLPLVDTIPSTSFSISYAYAPSVLTFIDGDNYSEFRAEVDMEVISNIHIFTGYRNIDTDYEKRDYNFNDSFYGGLKVSF